MKNAFLLLYVLLLFSAHSEAKESKWWLNKPHRLYQSNLRDIDVDFDIDEYIRLVKEYKATAVMFNVGGIVANYPTELHYHYRNPYLKNDLVHQLVNRLHGENIKALGRFDFSKINESLAFDKKEWLYKGTKGNHVNYNGQVHTCINEHERTALCLFPIHFGQWKHAVYQSPETKDRVVHGHCDTRTKRIGD